MSCAFRLDENTLRHACQKSAPYGITPEPSRLRVENTGRTETLRK